MRPSGTFLLGVMTLLTAAACERRPDFPAPKEDATELNGVYREKSALGKDSSGEFEDLAYSEFIVDNGQVTFHRLGDETEEKKDLVGVLQPGTRRSYFLTPRAGLSSLAATQQDLLNFSQMFENDASVRVTKNGNSLKLTRIVGTNRISQSWVRVGDANSALGEASALSLVQKKAKALVMARSAFVEKFRNKEVILFERVETKKLRSGTGMIVRVKSGSEMKEEEETQSSEGVPGKKSLTLKRLKFATDQKLMINGDIPATVSFRLVKGTTDKLNLRVVADVDEKIYQNPAPLEGLLEADGDGFKVTYTSTKSMNYDHLIHRYQLVGTNTAKPTKPTDDQEEKPEEPVAPKPGTKPGRQGQR